ncbi:recombinase family protein [Lachnotalea glycerini]|uniref:DNA invertase Pin-like site-specific DNA recombinase n=1 Tax=Lachnotalea glycerini TaxID=1763509 RepID=A0A371JGZ0_9FIRM|nr:recombinase family protein [Lachnotalea glycerini]RDY32009.1 hypothetical protein CG710_006835 [Lachnotalea glycerini]
MARHVRNVLLDEELDDKQVRDTKAIAAIYARKSVDDKDSLEMQIEMLKEYVYESEDLVLYNIYSDNGFTGTNFDRPAFVKMIDEMKLGKFNTIVVKDGSRLGRNYLEAGLYMESTFPMYNVRFISVNDHYDSEDIGCEKDGISVPLKNIMNEQYSKDLSRKLSSAFRVRQMEGKFIGGLTTYGYLKYEKDRNKLVIDEDVAPIIRMIFQSKLEGMSDGAIANELNDKEVLSPFAYRYSMGLVKAEKYKNIPWRRGTIVQMLTNPIYVGHMVQGRNRQSLSMHEKKHRTPENEWIVIENTHDAIVNETLYVAVQSIINERKKKYTNKPANEGDKTINLLRGKIFCADCGRAMEIGKSKSKSAVNRYYRCKLYNETAGRSCSLKSVKKEVVDEYVYATIKYHMDIFSDAEKMIQEMNVTEKASQKKKECLDKIEQIKRERLKIITLAGGLYEDYEQKILNDEEYTFIKEEYDSKIKAYDVQLDELKKYADSYKNVFAGNKDLHNKISSFVKCKQLNREMVETFISRVEVADASRIKIVMNCKDEIERILKILERRRMESYESS